MCGIVGGLNYERIWAEEQLLELCNILISRGPDDLGYYFNNRIGLGHRRLSVIDLVTGHQPMLNEDGSIVIVFNGEIYNFKDLRDELILKGVKFTTNSDTEVILKGYEYYGIVGILQKMEGMFAFALWDNKLKRLFLARDRFGEKPLYYYINSSGFYFASELKALKPVIKDKVIDLNALNLFFSLTYIPAPYTIYKGVRKCMPGSYLEVDEKGDVKESSYYSLKNVISNNEIYSDYDFAKKEINDLLIESVRSRMISDVPLGSFLSGGIDSSIVSAIMAQCSKVPINTFSIGFKEKQYDESERSSLVAKYIKSNHTLSIVTHADLLKVAESVIDYFDEPFADSSALPAYMVANKAKEKVTVVLTGDCADELFAGYEKYLSHYYIKRFNQLPLWLKGSTRKLVNIIPHSSFTYHSLRKIKKVIDNANNNPFDLHYELMSLGFSDNYRKGFLAEDYFVQTKPSIHKYYDEVETIEELNRAFYTDVNLVLEGDMLTKIDRMCMMNSLEARVPFLDSKLVEASFRMPVEFKLKGKNKKRILKDTFADLLPAQVFKYSKKGFGVPLALWFKNELKSELLNTLSEKSINRFGILRFQEVSKLISEHLSGAKNHSSKLWCLYVFQRWCTKNLS